MINKVITDHSEVLSVSWLGGGGHWAEDGGKDDHLHFSPSCPEGGRDIW